MTEQPRTGWKADLLELAVFIAAVGYGLQNIPPAIEGIPFVQVMPALLLGGSAAAAVDMLHFLVYRRTADDGLPSHEAMFLFAAIAIVFAIVRAKVHNGFYRLGLVSEDAETHYSRLSDRD